MVVAMRLRKLVSFPRNQRQKERKVKSQTKTNKQAIKHMVRRVRGVCSDYVGPDIEVCSDYVRPDIEPYLEGLGP